jgi:hypothetical protein
MELDLETIVKLRSSIEVRAELDKLVIGVNCTIEEFNDKLGEFCGAVLQEEIDKEIVDELVRIAKTILE